MRCSDCGAELGRPVRERHARCRGCLRRQVDCGGGCGADGSGVYHPPGYQWYWKADFVRTLPDEAIAIHVQRAANLPSAQSTMHRYPINGAAGRVKNSATPWGYRDATWSSVIVGVDPDPANKEKSPLGAKEYWSALHPYSAGGAYVNFMMEEGEELSEYVRQKLRASNEN